MALFNRNLVKSLRNKSADNFILHSFLFNEIVNIILEKLAFFFIDSQRNLMLNLGARNGLFANLLLERNIIKEAKNIIQCDVSYNMLLNVDGNYKLVADDEMLPFSNNTFDIVTSIMSLHNVNNLLKVISKINLLLKKSGIFIGNIFGTKTLHELKKSIMIAEMECGIIPRILPFITLQESGIMLEKCGYINSVIDVDVINVNYENINSLLKDLKGMGESNVLNIYSRRPLSKKNIEKAEKVYKEYFSSDGVNMPATFEIITIAGIKS